MTSFGMGVEEDIDAVSINASVFYGIGSDAFDINDCSERKYTGVSGNGMIRDSRYAGSGGTVRIRAAALCTWTISG